MLPSNLQEPADYSLKQQIIGLAERPHPQIALLVDEQQRRVPFRPNRLVGAGGPVPRIWSMATGELDAILTVEDAERIDPHAAWSHFGTTGATGVLIVGLIFRSSARIRGLTFPR